MTHEWTPIESAEFEAAREAISHLMAIYTRLIFDERNKEIPSTEEMLRLYRYREYLHHVRDDMNILDKSTIRDLRIACSKEVRNLRPYI